MKKMLMLQPFGLGDAIFAHGVAKHFIEQGYSVIWPIRKQFVEGLSRAYTDVTYIPDSIVIPDLFKIKEDTIIADIRIMPIRWSDSIVGKQSKYWMRTKYDMVGLNFEKWKDWAVFERDTLREMQLFHEVYGLSRGEKYNVINCEFRSDANKECAIWVNNGLRNVRMGFHEGYSLFDHAYLLEHAENIHVANSAIFYLLELLPLKAKEVHLYARVPEEKGFPYVDYLMTKDYKLHL